MTARCRKDARAARSPGLNGKTTDTSRPSMHKKHISRREPGDIDNVGPDRASRFRQSRRRDQVDIRGNRKHKACRHADQIRITSAVDQSANSIADIPPFDVGCHVHDGTRAFNAENCRERNAPAISSPTLQQIGMIERGGMHLDHDASR